MICLVGPRVVAVGSDGRWLVAHVERPGDGKAAYYFLDKARDSRYLNATEIMVGPLSRKEFDFAKDVLALPEPQPF